MSTALLEEKQENATATVSAATDVVQSPVVSDNLREAAVAEESGDKAAATDKLMTARNALADKKNQAEGELQTLENSAVQNGEPPPSIDKSALSIDTGAMDTRDLAMAEQRVDRARQEIGGESTKQMLRTGGDIVEKGLGLAALSGAAAGMLAALTAVDKEGLASKANASNMQSASEGDLFKNLDPGQGGRMIDLEKVRDRDSGLTAA